jgi:hypothetical protein
MARDPLRGNVFLSSLIFNYKQVKWLPETFLKCQVLTFFQHPAKIKVGVIQA